MTAYSYFAAESIDRLSTAAEDPERWNYSPRGKNNMIPSDGDLVLLGTGHWSQDISVPYATTVDIGRNVGGFGLPIKDSWVGPWAQPRCYNREFCGRNSRCDELGFYHCGGCLGLSSSASGSISFSSSASESISLSSAVSGPISISPKSISGSSIGSAMSVTGSMLSTPAKLESKHSSNMVAKSSSLGVAPVKQVWLSLSRVALDSVWRYLWPLRGVRFLDTPKFEQCLEAFIESFLHGSMVPILTFRLLRYPAVGGFGTSCTRDHCKDGHLTQQQYGQSERGTTSLPQDTSSKQSTTSGDRSGREQDRHGSDSPKKGSKKRSDFNNGSGNGFAHGDTEFESSKRLKPTPQYFACIFCKADPTRFRSCIPMQMTKISYVKQHLYRKHGNLLTCPRCSKIFETRQEFDEHPSHDNSHEGQRIPITVGTPTSRGPLSERSSVKQSPEAQWYHLWDLFFPSLKRPSNPYIDPDLSQDLVRFAEFLQARGPDIITRNWDARGLLRSLNGEEELMRNSMRSLLAESLPRVLDQWREAEQQSQAADSGNGDQSPIDATNSNTNLEIIPYREAQSDRDEQSVTIVLQMRTRAARANAPKAGRIQTEEQPRITGLAETTRDPFDWASLFTSTLLDGDIPTDAPIRDTSH